MGLFFDGIGRNALFALDAETAHGISIKALKSGLHPRYNNARHAGLRTEIAGLDFPNPLGMAAGYDKGADVPDALLSMGFGHAEIGTVTPRPQPGNPRPRVFRAMAERGVINRLGFNSEGHEKVAARLRARAERRSHGIVGVNLGANKDSEDFAADYVKGIAAFAGLASYFTINISSPNTPGLRALQGADPLSDLLSRVSAARAALQVGVPLFLKIAPDLDEGEMDAIAAALQASDFDALIVSNTTLSRKGLKPTPLASEAGGLSGAPLFERSTTVLARMAQRLGGSMPLIGVGGVHNAQTAMAKIEAGAALVQLYSGMVYEGPSLPREICEGMQKRLRKIGQSLEELRGSKIEEWAAKPLE
ncbi:quinone-dependent dihydroorotate dehydrogenase [Pseudahrensia aquimaris]|uniref:Dihydroorotate dehydrogenase (quinone) n=1 Tax=Pseudahrensia aquimaris TaxID=744461 RepID=A0ABW3FJ22_9HYPH